VNARLLVIGLTGIAVGTATCVVRAGGGCLLPLDRVVQCAVGTTRRGAFSECLGLIAQPECFAAYTALAAVHPRIRLRGALRIGAATAIATLIGNVIKHLAPRTRPRALRFQSTKRESFPSTHTASATAFFLAAVRCWRTGRVGLGASAAAVGVGAVVGLARIRCGAHWPTDVGAGLLLGQLGAALVAALAPARNPSSIL
jgi:membrane-associated phospholipid phosphatase